MDYPVNKARLLSGSSLFCDLGESELAELAASAEQQKVRSKQTIISQGSCSDEMYAVLHGRLKVSRAASDGREITLAILEAGDVFGELAMLDAQPRTASVETMEACELLILRREDVLSYLENHPKVMRQLIYALCDRLRHADEMVQDTLFMPLVNRLGKALRMLAEQHGDQREDGVHIDLKLTQQEIANLVGASRESVNKQLNIWEDEGILAMESGRLRLLNLSKLPH